MMISGEYGLSPRAKRLGRKFGKHTRKKAKRDPRRRPKEMIGRILGFWFDHPFAVMAAVFFLIGVLCWWMNLNQEQGLIFQIGVQSVR